MSPGTRFLGAVAIVITFLALEALVLVNHGLNPASFTGVEIGVVLGLGSLALEMNLVERAMRSVKGDPAGATFQTFVMRLGLVAPLTFAFARKGSGVDASAFAIGYLVTFFVYLCWLTWKSYHAPVQYKGRSKRFAPRVADRRLETTGIPR